jgi:hypothetical protein
LTELAYQCKRYRTPAPTAEEKTHELLSRQLPQEFTPGQLQRIEEMWQLYRAGG